MLCAELIYPDKIRARSLCCDACDVKYSKKDCQLLYKNFKIAYFLVSSSELPIAVVTLCHDCLFNSISESTMELKPEEVSFKILTEAHEYVFNFEPEESDEINVSEGFSAGEATEELLQELLTDHEEDEESDEDDEDFI